jgi:adenine/guanine phosphoribosyltransferase-like PRPP-binding protein
MQPHEFWQTLEQELAGPPPERFSDSFSAPLPDGRCLRLPIRALADGRHGLASLIINQASFEVQAALADTLAECLAADRPEVVVGLPTLGLTLASLVAQRLGHRRYVPCGTSPKFWYDDALSVPLSSITTAQQRRLYLDPRLLPLLEGRRVALVDDVISSGTSMAAGLELLQRCGITPVVLGVAMLQTQRWRERLTAVDPRWPDLVVGVFATPRLVRTEAGDWRAE